MLDNKTVTIRRKNVFLDVAPEAVESYMAKGYDVVDKDGNVLRQSIPNDPMTLRTAYITHTAKIKELEDQIKELKSRLEAKTETKTEAPVKAESEAEQLSRKVPTRKSRK